MYVAKQDRYEKMTYRRTGKSGLKLPLLSLGLWQNFGDHDPISNQREILRGAFDMGITHFDLANNYGGPAGAAEKNFGRIFKEDFTAYRDEMIISSKAGYHMWKVLTVSGAHVNPSLQVVTKACNEWGLIMWTSFTTIVQILKHLWKRLQKH